jgi:hypothetical protein
MKRGGDVGTRLAMGAPLAFDDAAADALAVLTLLTTGHPDDTALAATVLNMVAPPGEDHRLVMGMSSVCAGLLALLEFYGHLRPSDALRELGRIVAEANGPDCPADRSPSSPTSQDCARSPARSPRATRRR